MRRLYGVPRALGIFPGRVTYVIDKEGVVRMVNNATLAAEPHVRKSLDAVGVATYRTSRSRRPHIRGTTGDEGASLAGPAAVSFPRPRRYPDGVRSD